MIERHIYDALTRGLDFLEANPQRLEAFFQDRGLSRSEARAIGTHFTAQRALSPKGPLVKHGYPRKDEARFPQFSIILGSEGEDKKLLGDSGGVINLGDVEDGLDIEYLGSEITSSIDKYEHHILVITEQPDLTLYYYQIARFCLLRERNWLKSQGLLDQALSGSDLAPDPTYMPAHLFIRRLTLQSAAESWIYGDAFADSPVRSVVGIHVNDPHERNDTGGVLTQIDPYTADLDEEES